MEELKLDVFQILNTRWKMENKNFRNGKISINGREIDMSKGVTEVRGVPEEVVMLYNLSKYILNDSKKRKEKVVGIDRETFEDKKGKEIKLKFTIDALEKMEDYNKKLAKEWRLEDEEMGEK